MSVKPLIAKTVSNLLVLSERAKSKNLDEQAEIFESAAVSLQEKYSLRPRGLVVQRFVDLLVTLDEAHEKRPTAAEEFEQYLKITIEFLRHRLEENVLGEAGSGNGKVPPDPEKVTADQVMTKNLVSVTKDTSVLTAMYDILDYDLSQVLIVDRAKHPVGILTDYDIIRQKKQGNGKFTQRKVGDILGSEPKAGLGTVHPKASLGEVLEQFVQDKKAVVVIKPETGEVQGIITPYDCVNFLRYE